MASRGSFSGERAPARKRGSSVVPGRGQPSRVALQIDNCPGKYQVLNDVYEPHGLHHGHPYWVARRSPCHIFHTRANRWVISSELDDGGRCYAFKKDDNVASNPAVCGGSWVVANDQGQWLENPNMTCQEVLTNDDPLIQARYMVEEDMTKAGIMSPAKRRQMWVTLDRNGDGFCDLVEVETFVHHLVRSNVWPKWLSYDVALEQAFEATCQETEDDDKVEKENFHLLLLNIFWFGKLHDVFQEIDASQDGTLSRQEFQNGMTALGCGKDVDTAALFNDIDKDRNGKLDFREFCLHVRDRAHPDRSDGATKADKLRSDAQNRLRDMAEGTAVTSSSMVRHKHFADFDRLEQQIQDIVKQPQAGGLRKLWNRLDYNGNGQVSLAETDKWVVEQYPLLNHKPALMRAHQATLSVAGRTGDFVVKKDFKTLLTNLFYFNKLFWLFDQADESNDRRMDFTEFRWCLSMCGIKMSNAKAKAEFDQARKNKGELLLFTDFCSYFVERRCPLGMTEFIEGVGPGPGVGIGAGVGLENFSRSGNSSFGGFGDGLAMPSRARGGGR
mmetsp:Transcript_93501/g.204743  ORF Transcript_93501/g.204743 Transcript_93501/m.204743 type:complete len:557 (+) Transcript_93501:381-2051(+)